MGRLRRLLKRSRPRFWFYLAGPVLVGAAYGAPSLDALFDPVTVALFAYFLVPANVYLYGINDVFDTDTDAANPRKRGTELRWGGDPLALAAVALSGLLGVSFFAILSRETWPWLAGFLVLATAYSAPPLRLKSRPFLDSLSNGLYVLPGVVAYVALAGHVPPIFAVLGGWAWTMAMHTFSAIPDIEPDRRAGIDTTATTLGEKRTLLYCGACWLASSVLFALVSPAFGALLFVYPLALVPIYADRIAVPRAYAYAPVLNTGIGMILTLAGLWVTRYG